MSKASVLNKKGLLDILAHKCENLEPQLVEKAVDTVLDEISTALVCGDRIEIRGFGSLVVKKRAKGTVRNPKSGKLIEANDRGSLYFRASRDLIKGLNNGSINDN